jgi:hypothetical protein
MSDDRVREVCEDNWPAWKSDCSGFAKAVAHALAVPLDGNADAITDTLGAGGKWVRLADGKAAAAAAAAGKLVIGGLRGDKQFHQSAHGHVVVVVDGQLAHDKYPPAYWGRLGAVGAEDQTVNWAWTQADRDNVTYAAHDIA